MSTAGRLTVILDMDGKRFSKSIKIAEGKAKRFSKVVVAFMMRIKYAALAAAASTLILGKSFVTAAAAAEGYRVALGKILKSQDQANALFRDMSKYASTVSLEYKDIMSAATTLAGIMEGGANEVRKWMPVVGDLAAYAQNLGVTLPETTTQIIRFFSSGAAAADLFREKGINALLGFKAGVSYSVDQTKKILMEAWVDPQSKFKGMAEEMLKTWRGKVSLLKDAWFQFQVVVMEAGLLEYLKSMLDVTTKLVIGVGDFFKAHVESATPFEAKYLNTMKQLATAEAALAKGTTTKGTSTTGALFPGGGATTEREATLTERFKMLKEVIRLETKLKALSRQGLPSAPKAAADPGYPTEFDTSGFGKTTPRDTDTYGYFERKRAWQREQEMIDSMTADVSGISKYAPEGEGGLSASEQRFMSFGQNLQSSWTSTMENMMNGTARFGDFFKNMMNDILQSYFSAVAQMAGQSLFDATRGIFSSLPGFDESGIDPVTPGGRAADDQRFRMG